MKTWTYLSNIKCSSSISTLTPNPITFDHVKIDDIIKLNDLTNGYIELMNEGFFDGFSNDYNMLFVSKYDPMQNPIEREKLFEIEFNNSSYYPKNKKQKIENNLK
jgi:hypothetical protein